MRYAMTEEAFALPSSGFVRDYFVGFCSGDFLAAGTAAGEFSVFSLATMVYRASIRVSTNGVLAITGDPRSDTIYVGSGDGVIQSFRGTDSAWKCEAQAQVTGRVRALSLSADKSFLLAGTSAGMIYRIGTAKMDVLPLQESHVGSVTCVSFGSRSDVFCTGSADGSIRVWDLSDYRVLQDMDGQAGSSIATCVLFDETQMVSGWQDGCLRCHSATDGVRACAMVARLRRVRVHVCVPAELTWSLSRGCPVWTRATGPHVEGRCPPRRRELGGGHGAVPSVRW